MRSFYISYAHKDQEWAKAIKRCLCENPKNKVFTDQELLPGNNFLDVFKKQIEQCDVMIVLLSNNYVHSEYCQKELSFKLGCSERAALQIIPIYLERISTSNDIFQEYDLIMSQLEANDTPEKLGKRVASLFDVQDRISELYDAAEEYRSYGTYYEACMCCQEIIQLLEENFQRNPDQIISIYNRMGEILQESYSYYGAACDLRDARISYLKALEVIQKYYGEAHPLTAKNYMTLGSLHVKSNPRESIQYYNKAYDILKGLHGEHEGILLECEEQINSLKVSISQDEKEQCFEKDAILLEKIANSQIATLELFQELLDSDSSPAAIDCLKTSYIRLANFCKATGRLDNVLAICTGELKKIEKRKQNIQKSYKKDSTQVNAFKNYLGKETPSHVCYDIFISYKSEDVLLARRIAQYLKENGKKVFFSEESLPELGKSEYTKAIDDALDNAKHLLVVATDLEYLSTGWIEHEWGFFCFEKIERRKNGEIVLVLDDTISMNKDEFPASLRHFHICPTSEFRSRILEFLF